jgi:pimeloyl-ACP methyl ester carboxylesterase
MKLLKAVLLVIVLLLFAQFFAINVRDAWGSAYADGGMSAQPAATQMSGPRLARAQEQYLKTDIVTLRYKEAGTGDAVVLLHGYTASLDSLAPFAEGLAASHRVIALDVRGFGKSSKFAEPGRFGQQMVDDVVRLLDHLKVSRAHLIGHSMGALIAANVAARYPTRVSSATLIAGPFYADKATFTKETSRWAEDLESGKGLTNFMQWLFPKIQPAMAAGMGAQAVIGNDLPSLIAVMKSLPELAIPGLKSADVPVLVVAGAGDPLHPLSLAFAKASTGARLLEADGADHVTVLANPGLGQAMRELMQAGTSRSPQERQAA